MKKKTINLTSTVRTCFMSPPHPHQNPSLSVKAPSSPPRLAQSTNRAASDRQWHGFLSTHSPCGWEAQQSVPVGSFLPSQYPRLPSNSQTRPLEISANVFADTDDGQYSKSSIVYLKTLSNVNLFTSLVFG